MCYCSGFRVQGQQLTNLNKYMGLGCLSHAENEGLVLPSASTGAIDP
jgi:hypothetical protein